METSFQLADVGLHPLGDEEGHLVGQLDARLGGLGHQNGHPGLQFRRLDGHREPPAETGFQALLQPVHLLGIAVAGEDDLLLAFQQCIESVEKFLLRALLAGEKLDIVDEQRVHRAVITLEFVDGIVLQRLHHIGDEARHASGGFCPAPRRRR